MTPRQLKYARIAFVVYLVAVAVLCFAKFPETEDTPRELFGIPFDKIVHFLMFFPFPILAYLAYDRYKGRSWTSVLWTTVACLAGCAVAAFTELVQSRLPWRSGDPADFRADALAVGVGTLVVLFFVLAKPKK